MIIGPNMNLPALAERMGSDATSAEARLMRELLCRSEPQGTDTRHISARRWEALLEMVAEQIARAEGSWPKNGHWPR